MAIPIYEKLVAAYRDEILQRRRQPGDLLDSIVQIQRKHQVSRETAKRVLKILEQEGLIVQRVGKGSYVADWGPREKVWGIIFPFFSVVYEDLLNRVQAIAARHGREVRRFYDYNSWEEEVRLVSTLQSERYEAIIVVPTLDESKTWDFYSRLSPTDSPVVLFDHTMSYHDFNFVVQSYDLGVVRAMDFLLGEMPGGVAFIKNEGWTGRNLVLDLMLETYQEALRRKRPEVEPVIVNRATLINGADLYCRGITGIFCCDDIAAIQALGRLHEQGIKVPRDMRLVSYGNTDLARYFTPALTSVDPHNEEMAQKLVELVLACVTEGPRFLPPHVTQPHLVVRET